MTQEFVKGWLLMQTLGEGAYGEVKLLVNVATQEAVASKVIDLSKYPNAVNDIKKEICIHRMLNHENIIKFYGNRRENSIEYIFLEYASGGELFDRIEPDVGMDLSEAHRFFVQLISGVEYLHQKGIVHRDIKPENLLLDEHDNIKISDFGMATLFRHGGKERLLSQKCGTIPYMAPEIFLNRPYNAEASDIWSCGVVLVTLLAGQLPWDKAQFECVAYRDWKECKITNSPWKKIDNLVLSLLRKILMPIWSKRYSLKEIKNHQWFKKSFCHNSSFDSYLPSFSSPQRKKQCLNGSNRMPSASQPVECDFDLGPSHNDAIKIANFSQPVQFDNMVLSTQMQATPTGANQSQNIYQRLVKRMTRFFMSVDAETTMNELKQLFDKLNYSWKKCAPGQITISTIDKRRMPLVFKASVIAMNTEQILVDFRLSRGDGIEFKRKFVQIKNRLNDIIVKGPITWPLAVATNSLP